MHNDDQLPAILTRSTELLRELPPVRDEWRQALHSRFESRPQLSVRRRTISLPSAIAACLVCAAIGGTVARLWPRTLHSDVSAMAQVAPASNASLPVRFDLVAPNAARVTIAGDFNEWNAEALPMRRSADGRRWEVEVRLPPGRYTYGFVVDGQLTRDPSAPQGASDDFGIPNSVVTVARAGGAT